MKLLQVNHGEYLKPLLLSWWVEPQGTHTHTKKNAALLRAESIFPPERQHGVVGDQWPVHRFHGVQGKALEERQHGLSAPLHSNRSGV